MGDYMKKLLCIISVMLITLAFCLSGCTFIENIGGNGGSLNGSQSGNAGSGSNTSTTPVVPATGVEFTTLLESEREEFSLIQAIEKVERTSVAIKVSGGAGSGVIIGVKDTASTDVYIITCHHVISGGGDITVYLPDEDCNYDNADYIFTGTIDASIYTSNAVTLVGGDRVSDIAVIKIDLNLPASSGNKLSSDKIVRANIPVSSYSVSKGEEIFAIGNPSGTLPGSVSSGIVSYLERDALVNDVGNMKLMQIGVSTNPGNSGGGLYNLYGELIGITNAGNTNYDETNFAIPCELSNGNGFVNIAKHLMTKKTATNYGYVPDRWEIGISIEEVSLGLNGSYAKVSYVKNGSNAYGKLLVGDRINSVSWQFNGNKVYQIAADGTNFTSAVSCFAFYSALMRTELEKGDKFIVNVTRGNNTHNIEITINVADYIFCDTGN